ncbi:serine protease [Bdellovibrio bacteriovorus]|uniref:S1 family serine peptidase n=1 Tax=Bdellovibrio bacteriovorus TaxID=959 RepID=UPI0021D218C4|nr:serine protease [Bdellovibrio bacteriovorus]UXR66234.1 serine protease [Bdellovibrio bacteriovorus]
MKMNHLVIAGLMMMSAPVFAKSGPVEGKIVGGVEASIGEFPYIVSLQSSSHFCGGSLIKKNWVLTAAHCVRGGTVKKVVIGLHDRTNAVNAESIAPKRIIAHPGYNTRTMENDFALIELSQDSSYTPVALNPSEITLPEDGSQIMTTVAGWGTTREGSYSLPTLLQKVSVPLVSTEACNKSYKNEIKDSMICAGYESGGKDSCQGDSGGPLVAQDENNQTYLVGVVSWGQGCARANYYGVYAKVSSAYSWIMENAQ